MSGYPGTISSPQGLPWATPGVKEAGHRGKAGLGCALCPQAQHPRRLEAKGVTTASLASVLLLRLFSGWAASQCSA